MLDLDAIEARADAATEGPWFNNRNGVVIVESHPLAPTVSENSSWGDAEFIAAARADIPALVAELRAAREVVEAAPVAITLRTDEAFYGAMNRLADALAAYRAVGGPE
jgi:hypothetical protein